jgi:hypothetical protein
MHVYVPPTAFLRQIVVRPAKDDEVTTSKYHSQPLGRRYFTTKKSTNPKAKDRRFI